MIDKSSLIKKIIDEYRFAKRKKTNPGECPCYNGKKCHELDEEKMICLFCLCPEYSLKSSEGGCCLNSEKGKWFYHPSHKTGKIWDCSDCKIPHAEKYVRDFLELLSVQELMQKC